MEANFQQIIDRNLEPIQRHSVSAEVHFAPVGETRQQEEILAKWLPSHTTLASSKRLHIGVAGGFNFSIAAQTRPEKILLLDINAEQEKFWRIIIDLLKEHATSQQFLAAFDNLLSGEHFNGIALRDNKDYPHNADWITNPDSYDYLHQMACQGNIAATTFDIIHDEHASKALREVFKEQCLYPATCYWSNIGESIQPRHLYSNVSFRESAFPDMGKTHNYPARDFYQNGIIHSSHDSRPFSDQGIQRWDGVDEQNIPLYEKFMRHTSLLGNEPLSVHMFTIADLQRNNLKMMVSEGPMRDPDNVRNLWRQKHRDRLSNLPLGSSFDMNR